MNKEKPVKIRDLRPGRRSPLIKCIVIDVRVEQHRNKQNEQLVHVWVGDASGSIILQCWGDIYSNLRPGDMLKLCDLMASYRKNRLTLYLDRSAKLIRYGQDELLFAYNPNMSHDKDPLEWLPLGEQGYNTWYHLPGTSTLDQRIVPWKYN